MYAFHQRAMERTIGVEPTKSGLQPVPLPIGIMRLKWEPRHWFPSFTVAARSHVPEVPQMACLITNRGTNTNSARMLRGCARRIKAVRGS